MDCDANRSIAFGQCRRLHALVLAFGTREMVLIPPIVELEGIAKIKQPRDLFLVGRVEFVNH